tara:strand:+ start:208 stop:720 length:513 start_codon:yes stop_codon:yes gene_type:complete
VLRILSGRFKGKKIFTSKKLPYRPTQTIVRKRIFDRLIPYDFESVLDLFAGTGIMGFEAASRGAKFVTLVENNKRCIEMLRYNSRKFNGVYFQYKYIDAIKYLKQCKTYDLIFADPPYERYDIDMLVKTTLKRLNNKGKFVLECASSHHLYTNVDHISINDKQIFIWTKE